MLSFTPFENLDISEYRKILSRFPEIRNCEYAYANLFAYQDVYETQYSTFADGIVIRMKVGGKPTYLFPMVSEIYFADAVKEITGLCARESCGVHFSILPKEFAQKLSTDFGAEKPRFSRDFSDYVYEKDSLCTFGGRHLHAKKNHLHKFFSLYGDKFSYSEIKSASDITECKNFNEKWYMLNATYEKSLKSERAATECMLDNFFRLKLKGGMIRVSGKLCAYTIASDLHDESDTIIIHVEKGLYDVQGIYPAICSEFLKNSCEKYKFVNREDDLGDEGLRQSKTSYCPVFFEDKYSVFIKNKEC